MATNPPEERGGRAPQDDVNRVLREIFGDDEDDWILLDTPGVVQGEGAEHAPPIAPSPALDRYRVVGEIGRGGMGSVHKVWDRNLRRHLALKVISEGARTDDRRLEPDQARQLGRFLEEAQITGQLDHPGIVPVHDLGLDERGRLYFTMRLVKGRDLRAIFDLAWSRAEGWSLARVIGVFVKVCETLAFAHDKGVIHRDLKPANVMVGRFGEVYVVDWGLARVLERPDSRDLRLRTPAADVTQVKTDRSERREEDADSSLVTMDGDVLGTPAYMPPEQARGRIDELTPRSDVYSVGAMLYHLLAGHMPYVEEGERASAATVLARLLAGPPTSLSGHGPDLPRELVAICERAMAREPAARYSNMLAMADDLRAFLEGRVVRAYEVGAWAELRKWVARNRRFAAACAAVVIAIVAGLGRSAYVAAEGRRAVERQNVSLREARDGAEREAHTSEQVLKFLEDMFERRSRPRAGADAPTVQQLIEGQADAVNDKFAGEPKVQVRLLSTLGWVHSCTRQFARAEELLSQAVEIGVRELGDAHPETQRALARLAATVAQQGRFADAIPTQRRLVEARRASIGAEHTDTLQAETTLGSFLLAAGMPADAEPVAARVVEIAARTLGEIHAQTLTARQMLARAMRDQGRLAEAEIEYQRVLDGQRAQLPADDPALLATLNDLASLLASRGRHGQAGPLLEQALAGQRQRLGPESPTTLATLANLANSRHGERRFDEAKTLYEELLAAYERAYGAGSAESCFTLALLATSRSAAGDEEEAERLFVRSLEGFRRGGLAPGDSRLAVCLDGLARLFAAQQRFEEAEPLARELVESTPPGHSQRGERQRLLDLVREHRDRPDGTRDR